MILISNLASLAITPDTVTVAGYYAAGDGGGGNFVYDAVSLLNPDGGIVFASTFGGNWIRIYSGPVNVRWFGAIMGAEISPGVYITDVTQYVENARDSRFTLQGGTLYFPHDWILDPSVNSGQRPRPYVGAFNMLNYNINILGDGIGSVLKANDSGDPVLVLGNNHGTTNSFWLFSKVAHITINGEYEDPITNKITKRDGVVFDDVILPTWAGRWVFEEVVFERCCKGVYKPSGNIGNTFNNCSWELNDFGFFAQSTPGMHSGCDKFIGGYIHGSVCAGIYIVNNISLEYGQLIIDGMVIEYNLGFGLFIKCINNVINGAPKLLNGAVALRDVWLEGNAANYNVPANVKPVKITDMTGTTTYTVAELRNFYFEGVRGIAVTGGTFQYATLIESTVSLDGCRTDLLSHGVGGNIISVDTLSSLTASDIYYANQVSESIFVNSIGYDGTYDLANRPDLPTSVWGPLRVVTQTGNNNIMTSQQYSGDSVTFDNVYNINATPADIFIVNGGILNARCTKISLPTGYSSGLYADSTNVAVLDDATAKYYVWSIHSYCCGDVPQNVVGSIGTRPTATTTNVQLGNVILKPDQWVCSYGVKKIIGDSLNPPVIALSFDLTTGANILFADFQVMKFDNYYDAQSFLNSRAFAEGISSCEG